MSQYKITKARLAEIIKEEYQKYLEEDLTHDQVEIDEEDGCPRTLPRRRAPSKTT